MSISKMIKHPLIRLFSGSWHINISYHTLGRSSLCREAQFSHLRWEVGDRLELCRLPTSQSQNRTSVSDVLDSDSLEGESVDRSSWFLLDLYEGCEYQNIFQVLTRTILSMSCSCQCWKPVLPYVLITIKENKIAQ